MLEKLIKRTNEKEFYNHCDLKIESYRFQTSNRTFEMILSINQNSYDIPVGYEEWKLTCINTEKFDGFFWSLTLPYVKMKILDKHPLLLIFHDDELECVIKGKPENVSEFIGDLTNFLEREAGNWITVKEYFWNNQERFQKSSKRTISIPKSLEKHFREICNKHKLGFTINGETAGEAKGYANKPNSKVLIFGNEDVSPNDFNLNQPFIIAEEFTAERIK